MTLKELRISKGLSQEECAKYLGIGRRTYQNYETDSSKQNTDKYKLYYSKLQEYGNQENNHSMQDNTSFLTNVVIGDGISALYSKIKEYKKRDCYKDLQKFINGDYNGKICILYGLRRTGKTTMLFQMFGELPNDKIAYIKVKTTDNMANLTKDLNLLFKKGYKYIFIDEITLLEDFINTSAVLSDIFACMGMKIVVSGTDSLGFAMTNRDELYDRCIMIHTSFISFSEYERLLGICSVDKYIEYGGTLKMENMSFDDPDSIFDDVSFRDDESTRKYIDTAISRNIQHTLKNDNYGEYLNELRELYNKGELTNVINRIVENMNHEFVLHVIEEQFKSHDLGSAKDLMLHKAPEDKAYILYNVDNKKIVDRLKKLIEIKERDELKITITQEHVEKVKKYLVMLDLIVNCPDVYESGKFADHYIFSQPGMRYAIAKALVYSLMQDEYFKSNSEMDKKEITDKILEDVKGKMLEEIVLLETNKSITKNVKAFKYRFDNGGKFDMIVANKEANTCEIYEIKHSQKILADQYRHLIDEVKCKNVEFKYGKITNKYVIYRGKNTKLDNGITYINVEQYLKSLYI